MAIKKDIKNEMAPGSSRTMPEGNLKQYLSSGSTALVCLFGWLVGWFLNVLVNN